MHSGTSELPTHGCMVFSIFCLKTALLGIAWKVPVFLPTHLGPPAQAWPLPQYLYSTHRKTYAVPFGAGEWNLVQRKQQKQNFLVTSAQSFSSRLCFLWVQSGWEGELKRKGNGVQPVRVWVRDRCPADVSPTFPPFNSRPVICNDSPLLRCLLLWCPQQKTDRLLSCSLDRASVLSLKFHHPHGPLLFVKTNA